MRGYRARRCALTREGVGEAWNVPGTKTTGVCMTHSGSGRLTVRLLSVFFFSSRRRHTRFDCDWSSDVCSSDLKIGMAVVAVVFIAFALSSSFLAPRRRPDFPGRNGLSVFVLASFVLFAAMLKIGRASCRERV